jgi:2EXR family
MDDMALLHPMSLLNLEPVALIAPEIAPAPVTARTFTLFPNLPTEIQRKIYKHMMPGPRNVHLTFRKHNSMLLKSSSPIPVLLHLNRDARTEALKTYRLSFGTDKYDAKVYFCPEIDTLYFGPVERFAIWENDQSIQKWWIEDEGYNFRAIGCGYHELEFFMEEVAPIYAKDVLSLAFGAQALYYQPRQVLAFVEQFPAVKKLTLFYSNADQKALMYGVEPHKYELSKVVESQFERMEEENDEWRRPQWVMDYLHVPVVLPFL